MKKVVNPLFVALTVLAGYQLAGTQAAVAETGRVLSGQEVTALFSGKTVEFHHERKDFDAVAYYAPDGSYRGKRDDGKAIDFRWSVDEHGELCLHRSRGTFCRIIVDEGGTYRKYKVKSDGSRKLVLTYRKFMDGNPNGF